MNYFKIICLSLSVLLFSCEKPKENQYLIKTNSPNELKEFLNSNLAIISAHRGGSTIDFPENAIETFQRNIYNHPTMIETDIAMTKDSVLILMHDNTFERTTTGKGAVSNASLSEVKTLKLKDYKKNVTSYNIPTLEEALVWGKGKVLFCLDVKRDVPYEKVIELIRKTNSKGNVMVITYNANQAAKMSRLAPDLMLSVSANGKEDIDRLEKMGVSIDKCVAFVGTSEPTEELITYYKSINLPMIMGTFGNIDNKAKKTGNQIYYNLLEKGIQILSVDRNIESGKQAVQFNLNNERRSPFLEIK